MVDRRLLRGESAIEADEIFYLNISSPTNAGITDAQGAVTPGVTVVAQNPYEMGRIAALRAFARMDGDHSPPSRVVVPSRLIPRGSGEIPPEER